MKNNSYLTGKSSNNIYVSIIEYFIESDLFDINYKSRRLIRIIV